MDIETNVGLSLPNITNMVMTKKNQRRKKDKIMLDTIDLPCITGKEGYEFELQCHLCKRGILFNRNLINKEIKCPNCKEKICLVLPFEIQKNGIDHIKLLKKQAYLLWQDHDFAQGKWVDCVNEIMRFHRLSLTDPNTYDCIRSNGPLYNNQGKWIGNTRT